MKFIFLCVIICWVRIVKRVGYELVESGYEMSEPGYERSMGTKRLVTLVIQSYCIENESITLYRAIRTKTFNQDSTAKIFREIAKTLQYIYSNGYLYNELIHRVGMEEF